MPRVAHAIGRLEGVAEAEIDEKNGVLKITPQPAALLDFAAIPPTIRGANSEEMRFFARRIRIVAAGTIEASEGGPAFRIRSWPFAYPLDAEAATTPGPATIVADVEFGTLETDVARLRLVRQLDRR